MRRRGSRTGARKRSREVGPTLWGKKEAPGGQHTTRSGASSHWRVRKLRFGAAMCCGRFSVSSPFQRLRLPGRPPFPGTSAASSDPAAVAVFSELEHRARLELRLRRSRRVEPRPVFPRGLPPLRAFPRPAPLLRFRSLSVASPPPRGNHLNTPRGKPQAFSSGGRAESASAPLNQTSWRYSP